MILTMDIPFSSFSHVTVVRIGHDGNTSGERHLGLLICTTITCGKEEKGIYIVKIIRLTSSSYEGQYCFVMSTN